MAPHTDISSLSDEEIISRFRDQRCLSVTDHPFTDNRVVLITDNTVAKLSQDLDEDVDYPSEAFVLDVVANHSTIPVPRVRRVIKWEWDYLIVMDLVHGRQLSTVWPTMTQDEKDKVAQTLREYVQQLRGIDLPQRKIPGPLDPELRPRNCESPPVFGQVVSSRGPFSSYADLEAFFNGRRQKMLRSRSPPDIPMFNASYPLVLTHQDLNPRNIIVGDGTLWIVDWSWAGFYPEWWESVSMKAQAENEEIVQRRKDPSWDAIVHQVCGEYKDTEEYLDLVGASFNWS